MLSLSPFLVQSGAFSRTPPVQANRETAFSLCGYFTTHETNLK